MALSLTRFNNEQQSAKASFTIRSENLTAELIFGFMQYSLYYDITPFFKRLVTDGSHPVFEACVLFSW
jgi:hypothetical protein